MSLIVASLILLVQTYSPVIIGFFGVNGRILVAQTCHVETSDAQVLRQRGRKKSCQSGAKKVSSRSFPLRLVKL